MRWIPIAAVVLVLTSCGGDAPSWRDLGGICATPRAGIDRQGTLDDEKKFLRAWTDDLYLWYSEVPASDPTSFPTAIAYFDVLKTPVMIGSKPKDRFHFTYDTAAWVRLSKSGQDVGYGITWAAPRNTPPREYRVAHLEPNPPPMLNGIRRGARIMSIDGADMVNGTGQATLDTLNAGLFPKAATEKHTFVLEDYTTKTTQSFDLISKDVITNPVPDVHPILAGADTVGYIHFTDHLATAEQALANAINTLNAANGGAGVKDLILDIRYNGGGYLYIASELAYMIAGPTRTSGRIFESLQFNDKHPPDFDLNANRSLGPTPFYNTSTTRSPLPSLGLGRVFVLTGGGTCSASESVINGLQGVGVQVIQIGETTCGKPYGFYAEDNCGTTYFSIQFKGTNALGFGDYPDGFSPGTVAGGSTLLGCPVVDDFGHELGDSAEGRLAAALAYRNSPTCPAYPTRALRAALPQEGVILKSPWRQNRILGR
jgi:carboxyl-terminal processing protease